MSPSFEQDHLRVLARGRFHLAVGGGTPGQRAATAAAMVMAAASLVWLGSRNAAIWWVLPLALLAVDFLSGLVHWLFDTRVAPGNGFLGRIAVNFLDHHVHPTRTVEVGFAATSWRVALYLSLPLLLTALLMPVGTGQAWTFWIAVLGLVVAQCHKEAHKPRPSAPARLLQRLGLAVRPADHRRHHRNHEQAYCVFTGWCNPLLDRTGFWRGLERLTGARGPD